MIRAILQGTICLFKGHVWSSPEAFFQMCARCQTFRISPTFRLSPREEK